MPIPLKLRVISKSQDREWDLPARLELGRQTARADNSLEPAPPELLAPAHDGSHRLVVGWNPEENVVASRHALLESLRDGQVRVTNLSKRLLLRGSDLPDPLPSNAQALLTPPFTLELGDRWTVQVFPAVADPGRPQTLRRRTLPPGAATLNVDRGAFPRLSPVQFDQLIDWLQDTASVLQGAAAADNFLARAAEALVGTVCLHTASVLLYQDGRWTTSHTHRASEAVSEPEPSHTALQRILDERRAFWLPGGPGVDTVFAAPLLRRDGEVVGALHGGVRREGQEQSAIDDRLRTVLVEMLANAVSAGLARQQAEAEWHRVERDRALLEQFFPRDLAEELCRDRSLIEKACQRQVTVMFCDIRGFSAASEKLGPERTFAWVSCVLGELSRCVEAEHGVLVDYVGDELMAMWGAPTHQPDHAGLAVKAALAMLRVRQELDRQSQAEYAVATQVGIGLNSGEAQVGNVGSASKVKYGPLGDTVNVASRIQGMTKHLKCPLLVSAETWAAVRCEVIARRVVRVRVTGVEQSRDLYEVAELSSGKEAFFADSELALQDLESGKFPESAHLASKLLREHPGDGPLLLILSRAAQALLTDGQSFDPVWTPPGK